MTEEKTRPREPGDAKKAAPLPPNGPSTNREQVPDGLEGSIMERGEERSNDDNAGDRPAGNERRIDDL